MKNLISIIILLFFFVFIKAQPPAPSGLPAPYSTTGYYRIGWLQSDSGFIYAPRDTTIRSKFPGLVFFWGHSGVDTSVWFYNGRKYVKELNSQDTLRFIVTPYFLGTQGFLKNITGFIQQGSNVTITGSGTLLSPYVINSLGSIDTTIIPGSFLFQSISGTTKTINVDTSSTGLGPIFLKKKDSTIFATQTQLNSKQNTITLGTTLQYFRGDLSLATFPTNLSSFTNGPGYITGNQPISFTASGDVTGTFTNPTVLTPVLTLKNTGIGAGACTNCNVTFDAQGREVSYTSGVASLFNQDSIKHRFVDTGATARNLYPLAWDSINKKWILVPPGTGGGGTGTVTNVSFMPANGFTGTITNPSTVPAITVGTSVTGIVFGNGTALGAAAISSPLTYSAGNLGIQVSNTSQNGYLSSTDWNVFFNKYFTVANMAALVGFTNVPGAPIQVEGYYIPGDLGGGLFYWDASNVSTVVPGMIVQVTGIVTGRYIRQYSGYVQAKWFGVVGDGVANDSPPLQAAFNFCKSTTLQLPNGRMLASNLTVNVDSFTLIGSGRSVLLAPVTAKAANVAMINVSNKHNTTFKDFEVDCSGFQGDATGGNSAFRMSGDTSFVARGIYIHDNTYTAFSFQQNCYNIIVDGCTIINTDIGFHAIGSGKGSTKGRVTNNLIGWGTSEAITLQGINGNFGTGSSDFIIANNHLTHKFNSSGLLLMYCHFITASGNEIDSCITGISGVPSGSPTPDYTSDVLADHNDIHDVIFDGMNNLGNRSTYDNNHVVRAGREAYDVGVYTDTTRVDTAVKFHDNTADSINTSHIPNYGGLRIGACYMCDLHDNTIILGKGNDTTNGTFATKFISNKDSGLFFTHNIMPDGQILSVTIQDAYRVFERNFCKAINLSLAVTDSSVKQQVYIDNTYTAASPTIAPSGTGFLSGLNYFNPRKVYSISSGPIRAMEGTFVGRTIQLLSTANGIIIISGGGNIKLQYGANAVLDNGLSITLSYDGTNWIEVSRTANYAVINAGSLNLGTPPVSNASAIFTMSSTTQGVLFPRMTTTQQLAIVSPATGLTVFNTDSATTNHPYAYYDGTAWRYVGINSGGGGGSQTLAYTQNALNNNLAISGGNSVNLLIATHSLAGLMDSASKAVVDSLRLRTYTWPTFNLFAANGLTAAAGDSFYLGGALNQNTTIATAGFNFSLTGLPSKATALGTDSVLIKDVAGKLWALPVPSGAGSGTVTNVAIGNLSPLFTTIVSSPTTSASAVFTLSNAAANTAFGNFTGSSAAPSFGKIPIAAFATGTSNTLIGYDGSGNPSGITVSTGLNLAAGVLTAPTPTFQQTLTAGNTLTKSDTVNQASNNFYFTGSGQLIFDSTKYKSIIPYLYGSLYYAFGDSYTVGSNATVFDSSYTAIISRYLNLVETNFAVSGTGVWESIRDHNANIQPASSVFTTVMAGFNDYRYAGFLMRSRTTRKISNAHNAMFLNQYSKTQWSTGVTNANITYSGTGWTNTFGFGSVGGKSSVGRFTNVLNDSVVATVTDSSWGFAMIGSDSINFHYATFDVLIDNVLLGHFSADAQTDSFTIAGQANSRSPMAFFGKFAYGTHKIKVVNTSTNILAIDYFAVLKDISNSTPLVVFEAARMNATGYTITPANASTAIINAYNFSLDSTIALWPSGYPFFIAATNTYYTPGAMTSPDSVHPNNFGHAGLANAGKAAFVIPIGTNGTVFRFGQHLYYSVNGILYQLDNQTFSGAPGSTGDIIFNGGGFLSASNSLYFASNKLGVGRNNPNANVDIIGSSPELRLSDTSANTNAAYESMNGDFAQWSVNFDPVSGVSMNTGKAAARITMKGANGSGLIGFSVINTNNTTPTQRMTIFGNGNVGIGNTNSTDAANGVLQVSSNATFQLVLNNGTGATQFFTTSSGNLSIAPNGTFTSFSGQVIFQAATASLPSFTITTSAGVNPGTPLDGQGWYNGTNLNFRHAGVTTDLLAGASGVTTMGAFGSTPNANGGSIASNTLTLQPADGSNPGGVSTAAQAFAGTKTFNSAPILTTSSTVGQGWIATGTGGQGGWGTIPNIYNTDGTLTGNRAVTLAGNTLFFQGATGSAYMYINVPLVLGFGASGLTDANFTVGTENVELLKASLTANRTITLPDGAAYTGRILYFDNQNTTNFIWNLIGSGTGSAIKDPAGNTISSIPNGVSYSLLAVGSDGWKLLSSGSTNNTAISSGDLTGQTTATTIATYTTLGSGGFNTFSVGGYLTVTAVSLDVIQLQVTYTDETSTSRTQSFFVQGATTGISTTGANGYSPMQIRVKQGTIITAATVLTTGTGSITYDAGATITKIY